jgi:hypothetical protein
MTDAEGNQAEGQQPGGHQEKDNQLLCGRKSLSGSQPVKPPAYAIVGRSHLGFVAQ